MFDPYESDKITQSKKKILLHENFLLSQASVLVLCTKFRLGLFNTFVIYPNMKGLGLSPLLGDRCHIVLEQI